MEKECTHPLGQKAIPLDTETVTGQNNMRGAQTKSSTNTCEIAPLQSKG